MNPKVKALREDFSRILARWRDALDAPANDLARDSAILRFELAYEVGWKLLQTLLHEQGLEAPSPRRAFSEAFSMGWIQDEEVWDEIIRARNLATHVYREELAEQLHGMLPQFYEAFAELLDL